MTKSKGHGLLLFLSPELQHGHAKLMADKCLGRPYAGLLAFTEGLYHMGYISQTTYQAHCQKYGAKLYNEESKPVTKDLPKCHFCHKMAVSSFRDDQGNVVETCTYHAKALQEHPKWKAEVSG